jgi:hypothetical protein
VIIFLVKNSLLHVNLVSYALNDLLDSTNDDFSIEELDELDILEIEEIKKIIVLYQIVIYSKE